MCQLISTVQQRQGRADLHVHTIHSDGQFTPQEVIDRAKAAGLSAVAITDHDTLGGCMALSVAGIEFVPGVEITTEYHGRELHLLGYFVRLDDFDLTAALDEVRRQRSVRFEIIIERLRASGLSIEEGAVRSLHEAGGTLGRRHLAKMLVDSKQVCSLFQAFSRFLNTPEMQTIPKHRLPVAQAIELVHAAGGVSSWAHPPSDATIEQMRELQALGMNAVEAEYPWAKQSHGRKLRKMATELGLAITGGSDCHGPKPNNRAIGVRGITRAELDRLR